MGVYGYVLPSQALNGVTSRESGGHGAYLVLKSPRAMRRSVMNEQVAKFSMFMIVGGTPRMVHS
jgi:hypothetical protein